MTAILNNLNELKRELNDITEAEFGEDSKLLLTLYNPIREKTITGIDTEAANVDLVNRYNNIEDRIALYMKLVSIKEYVNNKYTLTIPDILTGENKEFTISKLLSYKSKLVKDYYFNLIKKVNNDKKEIMDALKDHEENAMSQDRIDKYVNAKFSSLKMNSMEDLKSANYETFAKEYIDANTLKILDPNNISKWKTKEQNIRKFYSTLDYKLLEFNSNTNIVFNPDGTWVVIPPKDISKDTISDKSE